MEMTGEARIEASRERVWAALNDPAVLQASIPGCEHLEQNGNDEFIATVVSKVGPIKARFSGRVTLSDIVVPSSYTLSGEGTGGSAGFARADIKVSLEALEPGVTLLVYRVQATVGGKLAQLGSRMIDVAARRSADDFFETFCQQVGGPGAPEAEGEGSKSGFSIADALQVPEPAVPPAAAASAPPTRRPADETAVPATARDEAKPSPVRQSTPVLQAEITAALTEGRIKVWIADSIALVTLNKPGKRNAMDYGMWLAMPSVMAALERNPEVRAILLTGSGADFCAGADISEFERVRADIAQVTSYEVAVDACCDAIADVSKPTIAVLRGYCLGGGAHLAMSCDFRFAAGDAVFGIPAARLSIVYGVKATKKLLSLVGLVQAKKILFGAERFGAAEALEIGFVDRVSAPASASEPRRRWAWLKGYGAGKKVSDPMVAARAWAKTIAANAPLTISGAKFQLNGMAIGLGPLDLDEAEAMIARAAGSQDYREGRTAFAEKRAPSFQGQ